VIPRTGDLQNGKVTVAFVVVGILGIILEGARLHSTAPQTSLKSMPQYSSIFVSHLKRMVVLTWLTFLTAG
jgi:hypothetical protein